MSWKSFIEPFFSNSLIFLALYLTDFLKGSPNSYSGHKLILALIFSLSVFGSVGISELARERSKKFRRNLAILFLLLFIIPLAGGIAFQILSKKSSVFESIWYFLFIPVLVSWVSTFPIALYLNHKKKKTVECATTADAN
jgi:hypothetical protein